MKIVYKILIFLIPLLITAIFVNCNDSISDKSTRPNFIILQADDLGWDDLPLNGNIYAKTPALDKLAEQSINFSRFYVNPVCAPSRASLLTGKDFLLTGVSHVHGGKDYINKSEYTFADIFKAEGYKTGMWGKWHSGKTEGYFPWQRGFDEAFMSKLYKHKDAEGIYNGNSVRFNKWSDEVIVDYAIDFIERNKNSNFIAYLSFLTCHSPLVAKDEHINYYESLGLSKNLSTIYAMIHQMDKEIGRLLNYIQELALLNNTIVMFMSDNGPAILNDLLTDEDRNIRYVNKYKGHKGNIWENGVKSPLLFSYPTKYATKTSDILCDITDIFPTMCEIADIDLTKYPISLTGKSFAQNLISNNSTEKVVFNYADYGWPPTDEPWTPKGVKNEYLPLLNNPSLKIFENQIISLTTQNYKLLKNPSIRENRNVTSNGYVLINIIADKYEDENIVFEEPEIYNKLVQDLENKFESLSRNPNSFAPVDFLISADMVNKVLLYAPAKLSAKLKIGFNFSYPWNKKGDSAEYNIVSDKNLYFTPEIFKNGDCSGINYQIEINGNHYKNVSVNEAKIVFEKVNIPKGKSVLKISVIDNITNNSNQIEFNELQLINKI